MAALASMPAIVIAPAELAPFGAAWLQNLAVRHIVIDEEGNFYGTEPPLTRSG